MAQSTATLTYDAVGNREDLLDVISNISPKETPFLTMFKKRKVTNRYFEWETDVLAAPKDNAQIEAADFTFTKATQPTRLGAYTQIFSTDVEVSASQNAVESAGKNPDEMSYQLAKKMKEHARDIEVALITGTGNSGASGTARRLKGILPSITTNITTGTGTGTEEFTETMLNDALQAAYVAGGNPEDIYANAFQKRKISSFTGGSLKNVDATGKRIVNTVEVYESDFGQISVHLHRWLPADQVAVLQTDLWKTAILRDTKKVEIAKTSDSEKAMIITELGLEATNEAGSAKITQLTTA